MVNTCILFLVIASASAVSWPSGRYSLPRPKPEDGCPLDGGKDADTRTMKIRIIGTLNTKMCYCTKTTYSGSGYWPNGNYCIARYGGSCPTGFSTGSIYWDDEDNANANSKWGILPDGVYNRNTKIYYCCSTSTCQRVRGMIVTEESVKMDDEDGRNNSSDDGTHPKKTDTTEVHYCYYS
ncbi:unnamed protein product [Mytilus edulis]|uniref:Apextrin C-terminal domain-containing protein n=1 Tax=Mytilus edulis TaxID=6550 RepID=A0A8S3RZ14_MYTED|nr:unnamed protein product [Mytilus edulis]